MDSKIKMSRNNIERFDLIEKYEQTNFGYMDKIDFPNGFTMFCGHITIPAPNDWMYDFIFDLPTSICETTISSSLSQPERNASQILQICGSVAIERDGDRRYISGSIYTWNESKITVSVPLHFIIFGKRVYY